MTRRESIDIHQQVTDAIVAAIEANPDEYRMPWQRSALTASMPRNAVTKAHYYGINALVCWTVAEKHRYPSTLFATFKQWQSIGAQVRAGEKGTPIVFYKSYEVEPTGDEDDGSRLAIRYSHVFNAAQVDGFDLPTMAPMEPLTRHETMLRIITNSKIDVRYGGEAAFYVPSADFVQLPDERCFRQSDAEERLFQFESTAGHELVHAAGHPSRLGRDLTGRFGSFSYAAEELVALSGRSGRGLSGQSQATRVFS